MDRAMTERRQHCRVSGTMVADVHVRVRAGGEGSLLNFSRRGGLIATRRPMPPGTWIDVQLSRARNRTTVRALVLRCTVRTIAALDGVTYETALRFDQETELPREDSAPDGYSVHAESSIDGVNAGFELHAGSVHAISPAADQAK
jgi:hypothetical protein